MNKPELDSKPADPREEELVAYLDGELSDEQSRHVEQQLASDEEYRQNLQRLERAWNCLDQLPATSVDDTFTRSTVEMIAVVASEEIAEKKASLPRLRRQRSLLTIGALLASLLVGFFIVAVAWPDPNQRLVRDFGLLKELDQYLQIQDVSFLRAISKEIKAADKELVVSDANTLRLSAPPTLQQRRAVIEKMSPEEKARLGSALSRFDALSPEQQANARRVYREIHEATDSTTLQATLSHYYLWVRQLSTGQRAELAALSHEKRLEGVKQIYRQQQKRLAMQLSREDMKTLQAWLQGYLRDHQQEILSKVPEHFRRDMEARGRHDDQGKRRAGLMMMAMHRGEVIRSLQVSESDLQQLSSSLSPSARKWLEQAGSLKNQQDLVRGWIYRTIRTQWAQRMPGPQPKASQAELEKYFVEALSNDQREWLLALSGEEMQIELRRLYYNATKLGPSSRSRPSTGHPSFDRPMRRPGGQHRRGSPPGKSSGKSRRPDSSDQRPGDRPLPPPRDGFK